MKARLLPLLVVLLGAAGLAAAQAVPGLPAWGTFAGGNVDSIDVATLNLHITVPLMSKAGVGLDLNAPWMLGSWNWQILQGGWWPSYAVQTGVPLPTGVVSADATLEDCYTTGGYYAYYDVYDNYVYTDAANVNHALVADASGADLITEEPYPSNCYGSGSYPTSASGITRDGSGFTAVVSGTQLVSATTATGTVATPNVSGYQVFGSTIIDRNNNKLATSVSYANFPDYTATTAYTDTLGVTAFTEVLDTTRNTATYSYPDPGGGTAEYAVTEEAMSLQTAFSCPTISEYSGAPSEWPTELRLPDGSAYHFTYEQTPGYGPGYTTGRITSVTLPTGATITYSYPGANDDVDCAAGGGTVEIDRTTPDGTTKYVRSGNVTTVTDPLGNQTVYTFDSSSQTFLTEKQVYEGSASSGALLDTEQYCYNGTVSSCPGNPGSSGVSTVDHEITVDAEHRHTVTTLDWTAGGASEVQESDWGPSGEGGGWLRQTLISYGDAAYPGLPTEVKVEDGSGAVASDTQFTRDSHGNPTGISYQVSGSSSLTRSFTYNPNGTVATETGVNGGVTTYTYGSASCNGAFPTGVTEAVSSLTRSMAWNCNGGVMVSQTNENAGVTKVTQWDPNYWRPTQVEDPGNNYTNFTYGTASGAWTTESAMTFNGGASTDDTLTTFDGLGRPILVQKRQGPGSGDFDSVETVYDADGRPYKVSMPYTDTAGQLNGTVWTTTEYDALGRPTSVVDGGGGQTTYTYTGNDALVTRGATGGGQTFSRQLGYDGLGRLASVCEVTAVTGSGGCGQTSAATGFLTLYTRNPLGEITNVTQNAQRSPTQTRSFAYDELGRMTSETTPEAGTTTFSFDAATSDCAAQPGGLAQRTDNAGNVTCYQYDALHRLTEVSYPVVASGFTTPDTRYFVYDSATVDSSSMADAEGRLAEAYTWNGTAKITDEGFSYDALGQVTASYQDSPNSGGWYHSSESYHANGVPNVLAVPGAPQITYGGLDGEGDVTQVSAASGQNPVTGAQYSPEGYVNVALGSGDTDNWSYDAGTGRPTQYQFDVNGSADTGTLTWNPNGTLAQLAVTDGIATTTDTQTCVYGYDDLARLTSDNCGSNWSQTFSYDQFGNIAASGTRSFGASYVGSNGAVDNRIVSNINFYPGYNADGDLLDDPVTAQQNANAFDAEGRPSTLEGVAVTYDALGRAVEAGGKEIVYAPDGGRVALMSAQAADTSYVPLPGGDAAVYENGSLAYYRHVDWQGSARLDSTPGRGLYAATAYSPFGIPYDSSGSGTDPDFTGQGQDIAPGNYNFPMRDQNPTQGRWWTPDPAGLAAVDPANPQTWNAYAYVAGQPLTSVDPLGLFRLPQTGTGCTDWTCDWAEVELFCYESGTCGQDFLDYPAPPSAGGGGAPTGPARPSSASKARPAVCSSSRYARARSFVGSNLGYAKTIAAQLGTGAGDVLGLSGLESGWGAGFLIKAGTNNYFSLTAGPAFAGATGAYRHGAYTYGVYPSPGFLTSGESFANSYLGARVRGITAPHAFASALNRNNSYNSERLPGTSYVHRLAGAIALATELVLCF